MYKSNIQPLNTIDGETLMSIPVEPLNFVVDSLISQGLHILAGAPKVGKSWLALWLATTIAKGESVWNLQTKQGTTLYLCLEDSTRRIQNRLFSITDEVPSSVRFCTESNILEKGLEQQLTQFLKEYPDTVLIIIDTLQKVRGAKNDNAYANDYRDLSLLKRIADQHGIAMLLVHHLRKEGDEDVQQTALSRNIDKAGNIQKAVTLTEENWTGLTDAVELTGQSVLQLQESVEHLITDEQMDAKLKAQVQSLMEQHRTAISEMQLEVQKLTESSTSHWTQMENNVERTLNRIQRDQETALKEFGKQVGRASAEYSTELSRASDSVKRSASRIHLQMYLPTIILVVWELVRHLFLLD